MGKDFLSKAPFAQELQATVEKWDLMRLKSFCTAKDTVNQVKRS